MTLNDVRTLSELADYINDRDDYPLGVEDLCEERGWKVCSGDYDICIDVKNNEKLTFSGNDDRVEVIPYRGGRRENSGRKSRFQGERKKVNLSLTVGIISQLDAMAEGRGVSRSEMVSELIQEK